MSTFTEGQIFRSNYSLDKNVYHRFLETFHDINPLHVSDEYAVSKGFNAKVMHGNITCGFISHFIGMCLPEKNIIIHSQNIRFLKPTFLGDFLEITGVVGQIAESVNTVIISLEVKNTTQDYLSAKASLQLGILK